MKTIYPPNEVPLFQNSEVPQIFLAGSIEMGKAVDWQKEIIETFKDDSVTFLNPRRTDWDSSWKQDPEGGPFREQVIWELTSIDKADIVFFYFAPGTISPISLMELGLCLGKYHTLVVCCPPDFHRYGNVKITCELAGVEVYENLKEAIKVLGDKISIKNSTP